MGKSKNNLLKFQSITDGAMTSTNTLTSAVTCIKFLDNIGIQLNFSGTPVGTFQVQISADYVADEVGTAVANPGNWIPLILNYWNGLIYVTGATVPTSVGSPIYLDLQQLSAPWVRVQYTNASGSGVLNAFVTAKEI